MRFFFSSRSTRTIDSVSLRQKKKWICFWRNKKIFYVTFFQMWPVLHRMTTTLRLRMVTVGWAVRDKRFKCGAVLTVIKMYRYKVYIKIFLTLTAVRAGMMVTIRSLSSLWLRKSNRRLYGLCCLFRFILALPLCQEHV